jgi:RNA-binding protein YlmH
MDIQRFIEGFAGEKGRAEAIIGKVMLSMKTGQTVFTDFLNPEEQRLLKQACTSESMQIKLYGGKGDFERAVGAIDSQPYEGEFPIQPLKVTGCFKFEKLDHRDYLGAILSQGVKREAVGDINVFDDGAEIWVLKDIGSHICMGLDKIKHTGIMLQPIEQQEARERIQNYKEYSINSASMRLDAIASAITGVSRGKILEMVKRGEVKLNYTEESNPSCKTASGDVFSIKGYGRYLLSEVLGNTKSGRLNIKVKKYI